MDYKKKYKEAVGKIKELLEEKKKKEMTNCLFEGELNEIFSELRESEDEKMIQYFKDLAPFDKAEELYEKYGFSHKDAISWLEKQGRQKPAEWSGTDIMYLENLIAMVDAKEYPEYTKWLISIRDRVQPQPKQEWSDEDNEHIKSIISTIECSKAQFPNSPAVLEAYNSDLIWLKSLRPQKQWKPTEEQIRVVARLRHCLLEDVRGNDVVILDNLLEQLKAL